MWADQLRFLGLSLRIDKFQQYPHSYAPLTTNRSRTLANIASAKKRARNSERRRQQNASHRSMLRTQMKKVATAIQDKNKEVATSAFKETVPIIDRMANKGLIHKNKAARHKHQLNTQLRTL